MVAAKVAGDSVSDVNVPVALVFVLAVRPDRVATLDCRVTVTV